MEGNHNTIVSVSIIFSLRKKKREQYKKRLSISFYWEKKRIFKVSALNFHFFTIQNRTSMLSPSFSQDLFLPGIFMDLLGPEQLSNCFYLERKPEKILALKTIYLK